MPDPAGPGTRVALRVLVADDHTLFRRGVRLLLATVPDVEVVGEAADGQQSLVAARELRPDLVLMDLQMPGGGGVAATRQLLHEQPGIAVLVLTMFEDDQSVLAALRAGARGYVLKDAEPDELLRAVLAVGHGSALFSRGIADRLVSYVGCRPHRAERPFPALTDSEHAVLELLAGGRSNTVIARQLSLSGKTVRNYISSIFRKLGVVDRSAAIVLARDAGLPSARPGEPLHGA